jgi:hypothetical protein
MYFENVIAIELLVIRFSRHPTGCLKVAGLSLTKFLLIGMVVSSKGLNFRLILNWLKVRGTTTLGNKYPSKM